MKKFNLACIIDDDPIFLIMAKQMMNKADFCHKLLVFHNGKEALNGLETMWREEKKLPDIIFLDLNMPVLDGWQFLDQFSVISTQKNIYIFILTSSIDPEDIKRINSYDQVFDYLQKPVSIAKFQEILKNFEDKI